MGTQLVGEANMDAEKTGSPLRLVIDPQPGSTGEVRVVRGS
jgi:hypothetical protein